MARLARLLIGIALVALVGVGAAACGGGSGSGGGADKTGGLSAAQLLTQSSAAARGLTSFRVSLEAKGTVNLAASSGGGLGDLVKGPLNISGEGPVEPPDNASLDAKINLSGLPLQGNITRVGDEVFVGFLGQDFKVNLPPAQVALFDFGSLYPTLAAWAKDPTIAGREDIDGTSTVKVDAALDPTASLQALGPALGIEGITAAQARSALTTGRFEAWIGTADLLPRRVHVILAATGAKLAPGVGAIDLDLTVDLSAFDEPVDITAPADAKPLDLNDLGSLVGG